MNAAFAWNFWTDGPKVGGRSDGIVLGKAKHRIIFMGGAAMKETVIKSIVRIGDRVFLVYRDCVPEGCQRYTIEEGYVTDVSANHGFVLGLDERMWRRCGEVGECAFLTLDDAVGSIRDKDDYEGFCFNAADGSEWAFIKRS